MLLRLSITVFVICVVLQSKATSFESNDNSYNTQKDNNPWQAVNYARNQDYGNNGKQENYLNFQSSKQFDNTNLDQSASNTHLFSHYTKLGNDQHHFGEEHIDEKDEPLHIPFLNSFGSENQYNSDFNPHATFEESKFETIGEHIDVTKPVVIPSFKHVPYAISKPYHISVPYPILIPVPHPYPIRVPVYKPVSVSVVKELQIPIEKITPYPVVKNVPIPVTKHVPYTVEKEVKVNVPKPYPVRIPVIQTVIHTSKYKGKLMGGGDFDHHYGGGEFDHYGGGDYHGFEEYGGHGDGEEMVHYKPKEKKKKGPSKHTPTKKQKGHIIKHKYIIRKKKSHSGHSKHNRHSRLGYNSNVYDYEVPNNFGYYKPKKNDKEEYYYEY